MSPDPQTAGVCCIHSVSATDWTNCGRPATYEALPKCENGHRAPLCVEHAHFFRSSTLQRDVPLCCDVCGADIPKPYAIASLAVSL